MKKIKALILLTLFLAACQEQTVNKNQTDFLGIVTSLETAYTEAFSIALRSNPDHLYSTTYDYLKENYFTGTYQFDPTGINAKLSKATRLGSADELDLSFLTTEQKALTLPFLTAILNQDNLSAVSMTADNFNKDIIQSTLSDLQKYQLLTLGTAVKVGIRIIEENASQSTKPSAKVDVKGALQSGVQGLVVGAVYGCYVGATGGTVAFPLLGTATGCVGGAVLAGATGFISGVVGSIVGDLLWG